MQRWWYSEFPRSFNHNQYPSESSWSTVNSWLWWCRPLATYNLQVCPRLPRQRVLNKESASFITIIHLNKAITENVTGPIWSIVNLMTWIDLEVNRYLGDFSNASKPVADHGRAVCCCRPILHPPIRFDCNTIGLKHSSSIEDSTRQSPRLIGLSYGEIDVVDV